MRIVSLGGGPQLAHDLLKIMSHWEPVPYMHSELDICDYSDVRDVLQDATPDTNPKWAARVKAAPGYGEWLQANCVERKGAA